MSTVLISWGVFVLFFVVLGNASLDGAMHQLNNLTTRYVAADPARLQHFKHVVATVNLMMVLVVGVARHRSLLAAVKPLPSAADA